MTQKARGPKCLPSSHLCKLCNCGRHRPHCSCTMPWGRVPSHLEIGPSIWESTTDHLQRGAAAGIALQNWEAQEEIAPEDIKYRLEPPPKARSPKKPPNCFSQYFKPQWLPFDTTCGECFKPRKMEPENCYGEKPSYSSPPLGQSVFPVHIQGRKVTPVGHPGYVESLSQDQSDFQGPLWRRVITPYPDQSSQGIDKYIQRVQRETAPGWRPTARQHQKPSGLKREVTILGEDRSAKGVGPQAPSGNPTTSRVSYMPLFSERVKLYKPKINSIKSETSTISLLSTGNLSGQSSCLRAGSRCTCANNRTQKQKTRKKTAKTSDAKIHSSGHTYPNQLQLKTISKLDTSQPRCNFLPGTSQPHSHQNPALLEGMHPRRSVCSRRPEGKGSHSISLLPMNK